MKDIASKVYERALEWLLAHLELFSPPGREDEEEAQVAIEWRRKAVGELALACMLMSRVPAVRSTRSLQRIADHLERIATADDHRFNMVRRQELFPYYLLVWLGLEAAGRQLPEQRFLLQRSLDQGLVDAVERTAWNQIDIRYYLDTAGFTHGLADYGTFYRLSTACRFPPIPQARPIDVYALTHILFHLADFGRRDLQPIMGEGVMEGRDLVSLLLATQVVKRDWDLVGELLICLLCLRCPPTKLAELAWGALSEAQDPSGEVLSRYFDPLAPALSEPEAARIYRFKTNYHPTLVAVLAGLLEGHHAARG